MRTMVLEHNEVGVNTGPCPRCHKRTVVAMTKYDYLRWQGGAHAQAVWPDSTPEERELLISGCHAECWEAIFAGVEE